MHGFLDGKKLHILCKNNSAQKIANNRLLKILVSALSSGIVWIDILSVSVVSGLANFSGSNKGVIKAKEWHSMQEMAFKSAQLSKNNFWGRMPTKPPSMFAPSVLE